MEEDQQDEIQINCFNRSGGRVTKVFNVGAEMMVTYGFSRIRG